MNPDFPLPYGYLWQYRLLIWIQSFHSPILDKVAVWLSVLGIEKFYILILPILFWSVHKKFGLRLAYVFITGMFINAWLKAAWQIVRPIGVPGIRSGYLSSATSYSMPSGHAQGPMMFWTMLYRWTKRKWIVFLGSILVLLIGLSRLYLGLHWPIDVLVGWGLGLLIGGLGWALGVWWSYRKAPFHWRLFFAITLPLLLYAFHHHGSGSEYAAYLFGIGVGAVFEERFVQSSLDKAVWKRICASIIGIGGIIAVQWIVKWAGHSLGWLLLRDMGIGIWGTWIAPWLFIKSGLYHHEPSLGGEQ